MSSPVAIVPLKTPGAGKRRLAGALDRDQRATLATAMLADVAAALRGAGVAEVVVAAAGPGAAASARDLGLEVLLDPPQSRGLNAALAAATARLGGHRSQLIAAADLPCLSAADVTAVLAADAEVVVAPTSARGTGLLLRRPGRVIGTAYGPASADRHLALAALAGVRGENVERPGCTHDVDTLSDLAALVELELAVAPGAATARALPQVLGRRAG
ncbi:MAG: 2-phospho-L-lactate guanylyltransferase [Nitriliruptoraceae bacterium]